MGDRFGGVGFLRFGVFVGWDDCGGIMFGDGVMVFVGVEGFVCGNGGDFLIRWDLV